MIAHDEGMMDEGAASLRDRDMIARWRGGPFVHCYSVSIFFPFCLLNVCLLSLCPLPRPFRRIPHIRRTYAGTQPDAPLSPDWAISLSCSVNATVKRTRVRSRMPISRPGDLRSNVFADFACVDSRDHLNTVDSTIIQDLYECFSEIGRLKV